MPKQHASKKFYGFRIDDSVMPEGLHDELIKIGMTFCVKEKVDKDGIDTNPHFQGIINGVESTIRKSIKKYGYKGNGQYGLTKLTDVEGYINYLCKGTSEEEGPDVRYNDGINLEGRHQVWWIKKNEIQKAQSSRSKKRKFDNILDTCYEEIFEKVDHNSSRLDVGCAILQWHLDNGKRIPTSFNMESMVGTYRLRLNEVAPVDERKSISDMWLSLYPKLI